MAENNYKWRLIVLNSLSPELYFLETLPTAEHIPSGYIHKPSDIDYHDIRLLSNRTKSSILRFIATGANPEGIETADATIASYILVDRLSNPSFLPDELNPIYWKW